MICSLTTKEGSIPPSDISLLAKSVYRGREEGHRTGEKAGTDGAIDNATDYVFAYHDVGLN